MIRVSLLACLCSLLVLSALAQDESVDTILRNDPFDPDRGAETVEDAEVVPIVADIVVEEVNMPVLDGIILLGKTRMALFSNVIVGDGQIANQTVKLNGSLAGYTVTTIERDHVVLSANGNQTTLRLFSGKKQNRGGSKTAQPQAVSKRAPVGPTTTKESAAPTTSAESANPATTQTNTDSQRKNPPRRI